MRDPARRQIAAIAGGVGAARMLRALAAVVDPGTITAIVNTGDDTRLHGLWISPDLDTVTYTLAGMINADTGWGLTGETWSAMAELKAYSDGRLGWFQLGDRDLGTHLYRTSRLDEGASLSDVADEIRRRWHVAVRIVPMSDEPVQTRVTIKDDDGTVREVGFQEYFVGRQHAVPVESVRFDGVAEASAAPAVAPAIDEADLIVMCPSNPIVSIGPVLATGGIGELVAARRQHVVAVSPIIAGQALKGPADRMLRELGHEPTVAGVARLWAPYAGTLVIDDADAELAHQVAAEGVRPVVAPTIMSSPDASARLARTVLAALAVPDE